MTLYDFSINQLNGQPLDLSIFRGKKVVVVNVASECGLTPQYTELEFLYNEYKDKGVVFIGVPCNDFGGQEPGSAEEIRQFCSVNYGVTFPLTEKIHTTGEAKHPLYQWLTSETGEEVTWNFQKFLIDTKGNVVKSVSPATTPTDPQITNWLNDDSTER
jgi:glutathione peroxidase